MDLELIMNKIKDHTPSVLGHQHLMKSAVLLPLIQKDGELHILFEVRSESMRRQPGEICFPGGRIDPQDKDVRSAAIRETMEELGIGADVISNVYPLDYMVTHFGMIVYPHIGLISVQDQFQSNPAEVAELFSVPLSFFLKTEPDIHYVNVQVQPDASFPVELIPGGKNYNWRTSQISEYFYIYDDKVIWGLTARILAHFIEMIR